MIFIPPHEIQSQIVVYLDRETAHTDSLVTMIEEQIEKLRTYRQALITAAVTGKIDVRGTNIQADVEG
jgi:type I restriction enzyme, S subunit